MDLRIVANYPATDGSMPESVEVEMTGVEVNTGGAQVLTAVMLGVIDRLTEAPSRTRATVSAAMSQEEFDRLVSERPAQ